MSGESVTTSATTDPLTYSEIRDYLRLDEGVDEQILVTLLKMSVNFVENYTGRSLITEQSLFLLMV